MKLYDGSIQYNDNLKCYGMMGLDGNWIKEALEDGDRIRILLGTEIFETKYSVKSSYLPTLDPLPIANWDFIVGKPAAYYDFETIPKKHVRTKEEEKRSRLKAAVLSVFIAVAVNALIAASLAGISATKGDPFIDIFSRTFPLLFWLFGGGFVIAAFLILATNISEDLALKYGSCFYYGTVLIAVCLTNYLHMDDIQLAFILSAIISGQFCYIYWIKNKLSDN